ncbi:MAG: Na/Pi cotransporter family protein, partial [Oscillospiraceae bacterium]|nr:Na/Pi cotransporter family protein [Oscillospiraceae bacterium]
CVGFVNAGVMQLNQAVGIIMGANIGTPLTGQILRLGDISSDNIFVSLLTPEYFGPILAVLGIIFYLFITGGRKKMLGQFCLGLGLLFIGITTMENTVS